MKPDLSVVIATYNRLSSLKRIVNNVLNTLDGFNFEIIVSDNCSMDGTEEYFLSFNNKYVKYYRNETNIGFYKNFLNGLEKASSDLVWVSSDDDDIGDREFFIEALKYMKNDEFDLVFGRLKRRSSLDTKISYTDRYNFKNEYNATEYINDWFDIRERLSSSCFLYKRDLFIEAHKEFLSLSFYGGTIDHTLHYYIIKKSNKIKFIDKIAYIWTISQNDKSISGEFRSDLLWQVQNIFQFPLSYFSKEREYDIEFFNKYILYGTNALLSSYYIGKNDKYFLKVFEWIKSNFMNIDEYFIFGKGEVGMMLYDYLTKKDIKIKYFIDDINLSEDCITYEKFLSINKNSKYKRAILVATYKYNVERKIMKKLFRESSDNLKVLSLIDVVEEC